MEKEEIKNSILKAIQEKRFEELVATNFDVVNFITGEMISSSPFMIKLRNRLLESKEDFNFTDNFVITNLMLCIYSSANISVHEIIGKKVKNVEELIRSSAKIEELMKWLDMETDPFLYVKQKEFIKELRKSQDVLVRRGKQLLEKTEETMDSFYNQYNELKVVLKLGKDQIRKNNLSHIITSDPDLLKEGFGKGSSKIRQRSD
jgi:hypothetical protein